MNSLLCRENRLDLWELSNLSPECEAAPNAKKFHFASQSSHSYLGNFSNVDYRYRPIADIRLYLTEEPVMPQSGRLYFSFQIIIQYLSSHMKSENLKYVTSLIANVGVLFGLFFLVLEVQQNSGIAATQARMDFASGWRDIDSLRQDESFAVLLTKSYDNPGALSVIEVTRLDAYYWGILDQMLSAHVAATTGVRQGAFESTADQAAAIYFANEFAQAWWRHTRVGLAGSANLDFLHVMDEAIKKVEKSEYTNPYKNIVDELSALGAASNK